MRRIDEARVNARVRRERAFGKAPTSPRRSAGGEAEQTTTFRSERQMT
jgi:hypothetical protein